MPHCIIEYSSDLTDLVSPKEMIDAVLASTKASALFDTDDIKIRAIAYAHHQTGVTKDNFIHVTLKILNGRSLEQKQTLSQLVLDALDALPGFGMVLTVDVQEMDREIYRVTAN